MKICVDPKDLLIIADDLKRNCDGLDNCDEDDVDDLIPYHVGNIRQLAEDLEALTVINQGGVS